jgi:hypothetical protein
MASAIYMYQQAPVMTTQTKALSGLPKASDSAGSITTMIINFISGGIGIV